MIDGNRAALNRTRVNRVYPTNRTCDANEAIFNIGSVGPSKPLSHAHDLSWVHREVFVEAAHNADYLLFVLLEHDIHLSFVHWKLGQATLTLYETTSQRAKRISPNGFELEGDVKLSDATSAGPIDKYSLSQKFRSEQAHLHALTVISSKSLNQLCCAIKHSKSTGTPFSVRVHRRGNRL